MIIAHPNDNRGLLYHVVNLLGQTVHAYRDLDAAVASMEGDQRIFIELVGKGRWLTGPPTPVTMPLGEMEKIDPHIFTNPDLARADYLLTADELREKYSGLEGSIRIAISRHDYGSRFDADGAAAAVVELLKERQL